MTQVTHMTQEPEQTGTLIASECHRQAKPKRSIWLGTVSQPN